MTISPEEEADCLTKFGVIAMRLRVMDFDGDDCLDVEMFYEEFRKVADTTPEQLAALDRIDQEYRTAANDWGPRVAQAIEAYCMMRLLAATARRMLTRSCAGG